MGNAVENEQPFSVPLFDILRREEPDFWNCVGICRHDVDCSACCWPYVLPVYRQRVFGSQIRPVPKWRNQGVHRAAWEMYHHQPFPEGKQARRTCHNDRCANPHHVIPISSWRTGHQTAAWTKPTWTRPMAPGALHELNHTALY